jgi:hypothetical protein
VCGDTDVPGSSELCKYINSLLMYPHELICGASFSIHWKTRTEEPSSSVDSRVLMQISAENSQNG